MARIRSVHPKLFTDESFASISMPARVFVIGLWTEADDQGAFEWKPVSLKMRLFPADNLDVSTLLAELVSANMVRKYEYDGREFGLIRNFRKFQRPKNPNSTHFIPDNFRKYAGLPGAVSESDGGELKPFPPNGETGAQMEEGGDKDPSQEEDNPDSEVVGEGQPRRVIALARGRA